MRDFDRLLRVAIRPCDTWDPFRWPIRLMSVRILNVNRSSWRAASKCAPARSLVALLVLVPGGLVLGSCSARNISSIATACVPVASDAAKSSDVLRSFAWGIKGNDWVRAWKSTSIRVTRGVFVELELVAPVFPPGYVSADASFPWARPRLSKQKVLEPARWCGPKGQSLGLQVVVYYFQAVSTGTVTAKAPLSKGWAVQSPNACDRVKLHCTPLEPLTLKITVT